MRDGLCFVNSLRTFGGAEVWMLDAAMGLRERGRRVLIVAQPSSSLLARSRTAGVPAAAVPIRCDGAPWTLCQLTRLFRRHHVCAVVCNLTKDLKAAGLAARLAGVPMVLASRESDFPLKRKLYYRWYFGRVATALLVNSNATRRTVLASAPWLRPERVHLLYKGVDVSRFVPAVHPPGGPPVVGFAGQLIPRKGLRELMTAWERVLAHPWTVAPRLRLAGEGELAGALVQWRAGLPDPASVELCGWIDQMPAFYQGLTLLVLPSHAEGFGLVAAEAGACGVPVVAADASSLPEIVVHGRTGLLVPPRESQALAAGIVHLLGDRARARELGLAARDWVVRNFGREESLSRLEALMLAPRVSG